MPARCALAVTVASIASVSSAVTAIATRFESSNLANVALDLLLTGFHLAGIVAVGVLWWQFKDTLPSRPEGEAAGGGHGDGGSDRVPPPWSWGRRPHPPGPHRSGPLRGSRPPVAARRR